MRQRVSPQHQEPAGQDLHAPPRPAAAPWTVVDLQRTAGNAAVARRLRRAQATRPVTAAGRRSGATRWLARYEAGEHAQFAGEEVVTINGVDVPKGNVVAMADFYRDPEAMYNAPPEELQKLNDLIERDKQARLDVPGVSEPSNKEYEDATSGRPTGERYMDLNKANEGHFAPPKDPKAAAESAKAGKDHKSRWEQLHRKALDEAHEVAKAEASSHTPAPVPGVSPPLPTAPPPPPPRPRSPAPPSTARPPKEGPKVPAQAIATNLFAAHFLTDAFASGHFVNKAEVMTKAEEGWDQMKSEGWLWKENSFTEQLAERVLADGAVQEKLRGKQLKVTPFVGPFGDITPERFSELTYIMSWGKKEAFFNLFARIVHDVLNEEGVEVKNNKGQAWKAYGDEKLNQESLQIGKQAVAESEKNLEQAASNPGQLDYASLFARVWDYVPQPTEQGQKVIDAVVKQFTDASDPVTVDRAVALAVQEIDIAIEELTNAGHLRDKPDIEKWRERRPRDVPTGWPAPGEKF